MAKELSKANKQVDVRYLTQLALLGAIIVIMTFTRLGYLTVGAIEITFITIPVVIGAIILGPMAGGILGGIFGLTSFAQCFGMSAFGALLLSINPFYTFIMCLIPRILFGLLVGVIFKVIYKFDKTKIASYGAASLIGALLNTIFFMLALVLFFWNNDSFLDTMQKWELPISNIGVFFVAFVGINGLVEACVTFVVGGAVAKALSNLRFNRV